LKYFKFALFFLIFTTRLNAQVVTPTKSYLVEGPNDSLLLINEIHNLLDSLTDTEPPFNNFYKTWDNQKLYFPKNDSVLNSDSISIVLVNPEKNQFYAHPGYARVSSPFGYRHGRFHTGTDIDLNTGDSIFCAFDGKVRVTKYEGAYGKIVVVRHFNGLETIYSHLLSWAVDTNTYLKAGDLVGFCGATGRATGSHLHFEVRYLGMPINSESFIDYKTHQLKVDTLWLTKKTAVHTQNGTSGGPTKIYTIKKGDTLGAIAQKNHTTVKTICRLNGIKETHVLQIGRKLRVQ
jgi:murein DD-endopeptidase MepM/ murein hydrolase activator NlpD